MRRGKRGDALMSPNREFMHTTLVAVLDLS